MDSNKVASKIKPEFLVLMSARTKSLRRLWYPCASPQWSIIRLLHCSSALWWIWWHAPTVFSLEPVSSWWWLCVVPMQSTWRFPSRLENSWWMDTAEEIGHHIFDLERLLASKLRTRTMGIRIFGWRLRLLRRALETFINCFYSRLFALGGSIDPWGFRCRTFTKHSRIGSLQLALATFFASDFLDAAAQSVFT